MAKTTARLLEPLIVFGMVMLISITAIPRFAQAQEACADDYQKAVEKISAQNDPEIVSTTEQIKKLNGIGVDPNRYIVEFEGKQTPITVKFYALASRKSDAILKKQDSVKNCVQSVMPLRMASDLATIYATAGLSLLLPPEATRIDWAEVLKNGKPLGGDGALIPKARDDLLNGVGLDNRSTPGHFLRDPGCLWKGGC